MSEIKRALLSVSDKRGLVELATALVGAGVELLSTGGTAAKLRTAGLPVVEVADYTGFPEMLDGRVKTLHPRIHGGLLAIRSDAAHRTALEQHQIGLIDLVVVNLYPFRETIARADVSLGEAIENIDIGGPAMIRSAAKNYASVAVVVDPDDYQSIIDELANQSGLSDLTRQRLAAKAFAHTATYDQAVAGYFAQLELLQPASDNANGNIKASSGIGSTGIGDSKVTEDSRGTAIRAQVVTQGAGEAMPAQLVLSLIRHQALRYGENPHQAAALYLDSSIALSGIAGAQQLQGKELSFNNLLDADAAWTLVSEFATTACVVIKHTNPCGVALGSTAQQAFEKARATDPVAAFGGILAFNQPVDEAAAGSIKDLFLEVIVAPEFTPAALAILATKKNLRLITPNLIKKMSTMGEKSPIGEKITEAKAVAGTYRDFDIKAISGGYLVQQRDRLLIDKAGLQVVTEQQPNEQQWAALDFAWKICKHVKSNAIVYANDGQLIGVGAGQMSRIDSVRLAASKAVLPIGGAVMASDAFFPFRDGIDEAHRQGITAIIQPGGSVRDAEVIAAANEHGLAMVFTGVRHFKH